MKISAYIAKSPYNDTIRIHILNHHAPNTYPKHPVIVVSVDLFEHENLPYVTYNGERYDYKNGCYYHPKYMEMEG